LGKRGRSGERDDSDRKQKLFHDFLQWSNFA
jgi:hypothetical protein